MPQFLARFALPRTQLTAFAVLLSLIALGVTYSLVLFNTIHDRASQENLSAVAAQAEVGSRFIADHQDRLLELITVIASRNQLRQALMQPELGQVEALLAPLTDLGSQVASVFLSDPRGRVILGLPRGRPLPAGVSLPIPPSRRPWVSGVYRYPAWPQEPLVLLSAPVLDQERVLGYVGVAQAASYWKDFFALLSARAGRTFFLFDRGGGLVASGLEKAELPLDLLLALARQVRDQMPPGAGHHSGIAHLPEGDRRALNAAAQVPGLGLLVVVLHDYEQAMAPTQALLRTLLLLFGLLLCSLLLVGALVITRLRAHERRLVDLDGEARELEGLVQSRTSDLAASNQRYRSLVADLPDMVYELDRELRFTFVSHAVQGILGYGREAIMGRTHREIIAPEDQGAYDQQKAAVAPGHSISFLALRHLHADGSVRWLSIHSRGIFDPGGDFAGWRGVARDVTDQVMAERRIRELSGRLIFAQEEERKRLALDLHDEMGQLLSALKIGQQAVARQHPPAAGEMQRLIGLTQDIVDRSRTLAYRLRPAILDSFGLLAAVEDMCEAIADAGALAVECRLDPLDEATLGPEVKTTLFRFIQEALTNAVKHSGAERAVVTLAVEEGRLRAEVRDSGRGFDADRVLHRGAGRRLGLLGMQERINLIGGRLTIDSGPQGTRLVAEVGMGA